MGRTIAVVTLVLAFTALALGHGKEKHIMGTVTNIGANSITVETAAKESFTVNVSDKTKVEKSGSAASLKDLKVGDKVVIRADQKGDKLVASQVLFGPMNRQQPMQGMKGMEQKHGGTQPPDHQ
jgi:Cu/Ag efflux protein CusF